MAKYNLCIPRPKGDGGTWWQRIGVAFARDGQIHSLKIESTPVGNVVTPDGDEVPWEGWVKVFEDNQDGGGSRRGGSSGGRSSRRSSDVEDDDIPI